MTNGRSIYYIPSQNAMVFRVSRMFQGEEIFAEAIVQKHFVARGDTQDDDEIDVGVIWSLLEGYLLRVRMRKKRERRIKNKSRKTNE